MKTTIVDKDHRALRAVAKEIPLTSIRSKKIQNTLKRMKDALASQDDGVALAAPQIGESLRIFIVSGRTLSILRKKDAPLPDEKDKKFDDLVFINPVITKLSKSKKIMEEGCLSVRWLYGKVERSMKTTIEAYDEHGKKFQKGASGLMAQIFQHEVDHLNGILFIDKAEDVRDIPPQSETDE